ncbi:MAG: hypothetical protein RSD07_10575 [Angelakisella sp.]
MKTAYKIGRRVAAALVAIGLLIMIIALMMGASWQDAQVSLIPASYIGNWESRHDTTGRFGPVSSSNVKETYTGVTSLQFDIEAGEVFITEGNSFSVEGRFVGTKFESAVKNGVWILKAEGNDFGRIGRSEHTILTITIPEGFSAEKMAIDVSAGALSADRLIAKEAILTVGMGEIDIDALYSQGAVIDCGMGSIDIEGKLLGKTIIDCGMGEVNLSIDGCEEDYGHTASVGMGEVHIGKGVNMAGVGGDSSLGAERPNQLYIDCGMGSVDIDFE